jgi:hypothetical protein
MSQLDRLYSLRKVTGLLKKGHLTALVPRKISFDVLGARLQKFS